MDSFLYNVVSLSTGKVAHLCRTVPNGANQCNKLKSAHKQPNSSLKGKYANNALNVY